MRARHAAIGLTIALTSLVGCTDATPPVAGAGVGGAGGATTTATGGAGGSVASTGGAGGAGGMGGGPAGPEAPCIAGAKALAPEAPTTLSQTGLYSDFATRTLAPGVEAYQPAHELWSDGAAKGRWVALPDCTIGSANMDRWVLPVGTRFWKAFEVDGSERETRYLYRHGTGDDDWTYAVYRHSGDDDPVRVSDGVVDVDGTAHDIPSDTDCASCHSMTRERALGFGAVQLAHDGPGLTLDDLVATNRLSVPPTAPIAIPGDAVAQAALGYLHANCGNCHHDEQLFRTKFDARVSASAQTVDDTAIVNTAVGLAASNPLGPGVTHRIAPGDRNASGVWYRMSVRQAFVQMPPLASDVVDDTGLDAVGDWIDSLPTP